MKIQSILCVCGSGVGTSLMMRINIESILDDMGVQDIKVEHASINEAKDIEADLYIVGKDGYRRFKECERMIVVKNILSKEELFEKIQCAFQKKEASYLIID